MTKSNIKGSLMLLIAALIWGTAFVAQSEGMDYVGPFTFNGIRSIVGGIVLIPCIFLLDRIRGTKKEPTPSPEKQKTARRTLIIGGVLCGMVLFVSSNLQQIGIQYTTVGKAGFITTCYIVIVPVLGLFLRKKCPLVVWLSVAITLAGLYLLCITESFSIGTGDLLVVFSSLAFAVHILVIDRFSPLVDGVRLSCIQLFVCGFLSLIMMFIFETPKISEILNAWLPILYAGAMSSGIAYTLQILAQKDMNPTVAALIMSLESVISVLAGWLLLGQSLSARELFGCALVFVAILIVQLVPAKKTAEIMQ